MANVTPSFSWKFVFSLIIEMSCLFNSHAPLPSFLEDSLKFVEVHHAVLIHEWLHDNKLGDSKLSTTWPLSRLFSLVAKKTRTRGCAVFLVMEDVGFLPRLKKGKQKNVFTLHRKQMIMWNERFNQFFALVERFFVAAAIGHLRLGCCPEVGFSPVFLVISRQLVFTASGLFCRNPS